MPLIDKIREEKLIELAKVRFNPDLKPAELKVLHDSAGSKDLPEPDEKAPRPEIRPAFLRWLAIDPEAAPHIDPKGLRVYAATIHEKLDLRECHVHPTLTFYCCDFQGEVNLQLAETRSLYILDSSLAGGIRADGVVVHGLLYLRRISSEGEIRLLGARIENILNCSGAKLKAKGKALSADGAKIGSAVFLRDGFESEGEIRLLGARIDGNFECDGAKLKAKGDALNVDGAKIGGAVFLRDGFKSEGVVRLIGTEITGPLVCNGAKLKDKGNALIADGAKITGSFFLEKGFACEGKILLHGAEIGGDLSFRDAKVAAVVFQNMVVKGDLIWQRIERSNDTTLNLVGARVKNLRDDRVSWPEEGKLDLDGLVYEELTFHESSSDEDLKAHRFASELPLVAKERIAWLMLQKPERRTEPQPWMQLRDLLERKGDRKGAKYVLFRFRCLQAQKSWIPWRWLRVAFAWLEENPFRIGYMIALTLLIGTSIFTWGGLKQAMIETVRYQPNAITDKGEVKLVSPLYPKYQPFVYTLENAVPLIKLGMDEKWAPNPSSEFRQPWYPRISFLYFLSDFGWLNFWRWALIVGGWVQATIFAAAVADRFRK
jgi:hypothetical protein